MPRPLSLACVLFVLAIGCARTVEPGTSNSTEPPPPAEPLLIAAASDLQYALPRLLDAFRAAGAEGEFTITFGSSGRLASQIKQGAPVDLFLSADAGYLRGLVDSGDILPASAAPYAVGPLVLVSLAGGPSSLEELRDPAVRRVALANPDHAPYGAAARQALQQAGLWDALQPRIVLADSVLQAQQFVETGNAEAGLVSIATARNASELVVTPVDPSLHDPIVQWLGVVSRSKQLDRARAFASFVTSPDGQRLLREAGFLPPPPSSPSTPDSAP